MNKADKGEKATSKAEFSVPVRYVAQIHQFTYLTPLTVGRSFSLN